MKIFKTIYLSVLIILAGTFFRFIDLHSSLVQWIANLLLIGGSVLCLLKVFEYIRPDEESV